MINKKYRDLAFLETVFLARAFFSFSKKTRDKLVSSQH